MKRLPRLLELNALSISIIYLVFAILWILLSDQLLIWITNDPQLISRYQTYKGLLYVLMTGLFLYILINKSNLNTTSQKEKIDTALYAAGMATWSMDLESKKIRRSKFHYKIFGLKKKPIKWSVDDFYDSIHPEDRPRVRDVLEKTIRHDLPFYQVKFRIYTADGNLRWMHSRGNLVYDEYNEPVQLAGVVADITEQKKLEEDYQREKELFESIFEQIPVMVDIYDPEINEIRVNKAFENYLGWSNAEIQEIDLLKACYPDPEIRNEAVKSMTKADGQWHEFEVMNKAGEKRIQSWSNIRLSDNTIIGIGRDITDLKTSQAEIKESRELLKRTFESIPESIIILDSETRIIIDCNQSTSEIFGYSTDELIGNSIRKLHVSDTKFREFGRLIEEALNQRGFFTTEFVLQKEDGSKFYSELVISEVKNEQGEVEKIVKVVRDITEKKKHEKELQKLTERYRNAEKIAHIGHWKRNIITDGPTEKTLDDAIWSDGVYDIIGLKKGRKNPSFENFLEMIHPDDREEFDTAIKKAIKTGSLNVRYRLIKPSTGEIGYYHGLAKTEYDERGNPVSISGTIQDITEIKRSQAQLQESQELLEKTFESLQESVIILDPETRTITNCNRTTCELFGYSENELKGNTTEMLHIDESHFNEFAEMGAEDLEQRGVFQTEFKLKKKDGTVFHSDHTVTLVKNEEGEVEKIVSVVRDITERKKHEEKLQNITERYRKAEEIADFGHWWRDIKNDYAIFSQGYYDIVGVKPSQMDSRFETSVNLIHPDDRDEYREAFETALESGTLNVRYRIIKPDTGEIGYFQELAETEYDEEGNAVSISGTIQDTTEREEFQIALTKRNKFIGTTLENLPIGVAVNLIDSGETTLMNKQFSKIYGWPKEILKDVETFFESVFPDEAYRQRMMETMMADVNSQDTERMNWEGVEVTTQSGNKKIINAKNIPLYDQNLMISTVVDVTAQVEAERRLAESEHNYRLLFQKNPLPMLITNPETLEIIEVNTASLEHYGYTRKEFQEMPLLSLLPEQDVSSARKFLQSKPFEDQAEWGEWRHQKKSGELVYVKTTGSKIDYFGKQYWLILINDITEQKEAEEKVLASLVEGENKERARIAQELHDGLGQYLAAANMNLDAASSEIDALSNRKKKQFQKGMNLLKHAVTETAQISRNLLPRVVDDYGLALAIESLVDNYQSGTDINVKYYHNIKDLELPREVQFNLYRIAQEGISNAIKYSEASKINVQLIKDELDLILTIDDNGKGFDADSETFEPGLGLQTIKTRAGALGGTFEFDSKLNKGTFLNVVVPILKNSNTS